MSKIFQFKKKTKAPQVKQSEGAFLVCGKQYNRLTTLLSSFIEGVSLPGQITWVGHSFYLKVSNLYVRVDPLCTFRENKAIMTGISIKLLNKFKGLIDGQEFAFAEIWGSNTFDYYDLQKDKWINCNPNETEKLLIGMTLKAYLEVFL